jgi:tetratricopeptide (TPR) repeat protein
MNGLAYFLIEHEINVNEGMELITRALEIEPENLSFLYTKGFAYHKQGKVKEAQEILKKTWDLRPRYNHEHYLLLQEAEQALASQNQ